MQRKHCSFVSFVIRVIQSCCLINKIIINVNKTLLIFTHIMYLEYRICFLATNIMISNECRTIRMVCFSPNFLHGSFWQFFKNSIKVELEIFMQQAFQSFNFWMSWDFEHFLHQKFLSISASLWLAVISISYIEIYMYIYIGRGRWLNQVGLITD